MKKLSLGKKLMALVLLSMIILAFALFHISSWEHGTKVDEYYRSNASKLALSVAHSLDGDFIGQLREIVDEEDFKSLREKAEA